MNPTRSGFIEGGLYTVYNERGETDYSFDAVQWNGHGLSKIHLTHCGLIERSAARGSMFGNAVYLDFSQGTTMCGVLIPHEREVNVSSGELCVRCERLART